MFRNNYFLVFIMDDYEEVVDKFKGVKIWWVFGKNVSKIYIILFYLIIDEKRYYKFIFYKKNRDFIIGFYLNYVIKEGKVIKVRNWQRKLYINNGV